MHPQHIPPRPLLVAFACALAMALAVPSLASADRPTFLNDHESAPAPTQVLNGDRPSERGDFAATSGSTASSADDDGGDAALIIGLSLAGLAAGGATWVVVRRRHGDRLTPRGVA